MLKEKHFPDSMFDQYLRILNRFEIALKIDSDKILIPWLLPLRQPESEPMLQNKKKCYKRIISFKNIPSGFLSRIMVSTICYLLSKSKDIHVKTTEDINEKESQKEGLEKVKETEEKADEVNGTHQEGVPPRRRSNAITSTARSVSVVSPTSYIFSEPFVSPVKLLLREPSQESTDDLLRDAVNGTDSRSCSSDLKSGSSSAEIQAELSTDITYTSENSSNADFDNAFRSTNTFENKLFDLLWSPSPAASPTKLVVDLNTDSSSSHQDNEPDRRLLHRIKSHLGMGVRRETKALQRSHSVESKVEIRDIRLLDDASERYSPPERDAPEYAILGTYYVNY